MTNRTVTIDYWNIERTTKRYPDGGRYESRESKIISSKDYLIESDDDLINLFKQFDKNNNHLKYCNGIYYKFNDPKVNDEYLAWYESLPEDIKFEMYYGGGVVD